MMASVALLGWGTLVGLDLVSGPQVMIARPLVAGAVAGVLLGDPAAGVTVGAVLELYALEVLPVGAAQYPDYGPAAVAAAVVAAGAPLEFALGLAVAVGLLVAWLGGASMHQLRAWNARRVHRHVAALDRGDAATLRRLHATCFAADLARSGLLTAIGLAGAALARQIPGLTVRAAMVAGLIVVGVGLATAVTGAVRLSGRGVAARWLAAGIALGVALAVWR